MIPFWIIGVFVLVTGVVAFQWNLLLGLIIVMGGVVVILLYVVFAPKYPVSVLVFVKRRGNLRLIKDRASRQEMEKGSGTYKYKFKGLKEETRAAFYENLYPSGRGGEIALFFSPAPGEYYQAAFTEDMKKKTIKYEKDGKKKTEEVEEAMIKPVPDNLLEFMILKQQRMKQKYMKQSMWDKFYPIIVIAVLAICVAVILNSTFSGLAPVVESFEKASSKLSKSAEVQAETTDRLINIMKDMGIDMGSGDTIKPIPAPPDV